MTEPRPGGGKLARRVREALATLLRRVRGERYDVTAATIDGGDVHQVIAPAWMGVSIYGGPARYEADLRRFTTAQRHLLACLWYQAEVNNGGHHQFFFNSTGVVWRDAVAGFRRIGAPDIAAIVEEAASRLGGASVDRTERQEQLERAGAEFDDLDRRFYDLEDAGLDERLRAFVRANREAFLFSGRVRPVA